MFPRSRSSYIFLKVQHRVQYVSQLILYPARKCRYDVYGFCDSAALVVEYRRLFSDRQIPKREVFIRDTFSVYSIPLAYYMNIVQMLLLRVERVFTEKFFSLFWVKESVETFRDEYITVVYKLEKG